MKDFFLFCLLLWTAVTPLTAQRLERLEAIRIISIAEVDSNHSAVQGGMDSPYVASQFLECRTDNGVAGYVLELMGQFRDFEDFYEFDTHARSGGKRISIGLTEVQRTEQLLVDELNRITDEVHFIPRPFTSPQFYRYMKQYIFYQNEEGDTCVHINLFFPSESFSPDKYYVEIYDGDEVRWTASVNLSKSRVMSFSINGPTTYLIIGRSLERFGLSQECVFPDHEMYSGFCSLEELPSQVQKGILNGMQQHDILQIAAFHPLVRRGYHRRELSKNYYMVTWRDGSRDGFDSKGRWAYTDAGSSRWPEAYTSECHVPTLDKMLTYMKKDLESRGFDFSANVFLQKVEKVKRHYVMFVDCNASLPADRRRIAYTFDESGRFTGIDIRLKQY